MIALQLLQLLHLADSALPIGTAAHSFGLEGLVAENDLEVADLRDFFRGTCRRGVVWKLYLFMRATTLHQRSSGNT